MSAQMQKLQILEQLLLKAWALLVKSGLKGTFLDGLAGVERAEMLQRIEKWQNSDMRRQKYDGSGNSSSKMRSEMSDRTSSQTINHDKPCKDYTTFQLHLTKVLSTRAVTTTPLTPSAPPCLSSQVPDCRSCTSSPLTEDELCEDYTKSQNHPTSKVPITGAVVTPTKAPSVPLHLSSPVPSCRSCTSHLLPGDEAPPPSPPTHGTKTSSEDMASLPLKKRGGAMMNPCTVGTGCLTSECGRVTSSTVVDSPNGEHHLEAVSYSGTVELRPTRGADASEITAWTTSAPSTSPTSLGPPVVKEKQLPSAVLITSATASRVDSKVSSLSSQEGTGIHIGPFEVSAIPEKQPPPKLPIVPSATTSHSSDSVDSSPPLEEGTICSRRVNVLPMKVKPPTAISTTTRTTPKKVNTIDGSSTTEGQTIPGSPVDASKLLLSDDLNNFNVVQEETVGLSTEMDERSDISEETFIPPCSGTVRKQTEKRFLSPACRSQSPHRPPHVRDNLCGECGKLFASRRNLRHHVKVIHESEQTYPCGVCARVFRHSQNLTIHKQNKNHFGTEEQHLMKPMKCHMCSLCHKTFQIKSNLEAHFRLHTGAMPFKCSYCNRRFTQSSNCKKHELTHTHQRPFSCDKCHRTFTSSCNMQRHREAIHGGGEGFLCTLCGKTFTQRWNLKRHEQNHT